MANYPKSLSEMLGMIERKKQHYTIRHGSGDVSQCEDCFLFEIVITEAVFVEIAERLGIKSDTPSVTA